MKTNLNDFEHNVTSMGDARSQLSHAWKVTHRNGEIISVCCVKPKGKKKEQMESVYRVVCIFKPFYLCDDHYISSGK